MNKIKINWPNGNFSFTSKGTQWLSEAKKAGISIPTGCLNGSCGACEIEVNGIVIRACISKIERMSSDTLDVEIPMDPYW